MLQKKGPKTDATSHAPALLGRQPDREHGIAMGSGGRTTVPSVASCLQPAAALLALIPACIYCELIPNQSKGWSSTPSASTVAASSVVLFAALWLFELCARRILDRSFAEHPLLKAPQYRQILARHAMDTVGLAYIGYMGMSMWRELKYEEIATTAHGRVYVYLPRFAWTCVCMLAFQVKNLLDTLTYHDGPEFIAHHVVCILVAVGALHGQFLHLYGIFFFGISEVSTALVSLLACFDEQHGIAELGDHFPTCKMAVGSAFAIAFIAIRAVIWPYLAYHVTIDCMAVIAEGSAHSEGIVYAFLTGLAGLTVLQFYWLAEILRRAPAELRAAMQTAKAGGKAD